MCKNENIADHYLEFEKNHILHEYWHFRYLYNVYENVVTFFVECKTTERNDVRLLCE